MKRKYFLVSGYFKDDRDSVFQDEIVTNYDDEPCQEDLDKLPKNIFWYGYDESDLKIAIQAGEETAYDFVITKYENLEL